MIASPSDLVEERQAVTDAINEWNVHHSAAESIVLLPVKWETHAAPRANVRPQQAINEQLVKCSDMVIGLFWTKLGTNTGVAESGTVEEIDQFVAEKKPTMLYFSNRPIDPDKIDVNQHKKLKRFKAATYENALVGTFKELNQLKHTVLRDLTSEVRRIRPKRGRNSDRLEQAAKITEIIQKHRKSKITPEEFDEYRNQLLGRRNRHKSLTTDPVPPGEVGPNGYPIGYTKEGDKVEWIPDDEFPGEFWPMVLRRSDKAILAEYNRYWDMVWYNRHMVMWDRIQAGKEKPSKELLKGHQAALKIEKKYGRKNLLFDDFEWGKVYGRMTALAWVTGTDWECAGDT